MELVLFPDVSSASSCDSWM